MKEKDTMYPDAVQAFDDIAAIFEISDDDKLSFQTYMLQRLMSFERDAFQITGDCLLQPVSDSNPVSQKTDVVTITTDRSSTAYTLTCEAIGWLYMHLSAQDDRPRLLAQYL
jgi:hypothetical protein